MQKNSKMMMKNQKRICHKCKKIIKYKIQPPMIKRKLTCGKCYYCISGSEQFCLKGKMIGKDVNGGYAELIAVPTRGIFKLPSSISFEHASVMMCSSATSLHALKKTSFQPGETLAIFGMGGLGVSALQLAKAFGSREIYAVDIDDKKLSYAKKLGAIPINAIKDDPGIIVFIRVFVPDIIIPVWIIF